MSHVSVMLPEVLEALAPKDGEVYIDGTFGAGGYTKAILEAATCSVIAIDRDDSAIERAKDMAGVTPVHGAFGDVKRHLRDLDIEGVDGFVLDLGVSSMQIDQADRGFSFNKDGPLDMRMDRSSGEPASEYVNSMDEKDLADIIWKYGEERHSRKIAKAIVTARAIAPIETTLQLVEIVSKAMPGSAKKFGINPATRTFQALRIYVNGELDQLEDALSASLSILKTGGRLVVVSFHSLEDSIVKAFLREQGPSQPGSRHMPATIVVPPKFTQPVKKSIPPSEAECSANPRARSAKLRWAVRTEERIAA